MIKLAIEGGKPLRDTPYPAWPVSGPREEELLRRVLFSEQWGGYSELVTELEQLFAGLHDARYGVAVANGTLALELTLLAAGIGPGDEVLVPAHSFIATATAVSRVGAVPVFVDIDKRSFNMDPERAEAETTKRTRAMIVVHFAGQIADMDRLEDLAKSRSLIVISDAAHAHGAEWRGLRAGGYGLASTFSFQNSKAMSAGEGGLVISNDEEFTARARSLANGGRRPDGGWFEHFELGSNFRMTGFQAAVLLAQLERLGEQVRLRRDNAEELRKALDGTPGIYLQQQPEAASAHTLYLLPGWVDEDEFGADRDDFVAALEAEGVPVRAFYPHPLYKNPMYEKLPHRVGECPVAEEASEDSFWLPQRTLMGSVEDTLDIARATVKIHEALKLTSS